MPINTLGQGNSANTPLKQEALDYFMHVHAGIVAHAQHWGSNYYYIDTNAGTGRNDDGTDGSVRIAKKVVQQHNLILHGYAMEIKDGAVSELRKNVVPSNMIDVLHGDNASLLVPTLLPQQPWLFGLVYCDPHGIDDLPVEALIRFFDRHVLATQRIDLLMHFSANVLKRCRGARLSKPTLPALMSQINKRHWYIRELNDRDQWTFLFGTNFKKWPELRLKVRGAELHGLRSLGMYDCATAKAQSILDKAIYTNEELQKKTMRDLFPIEATANI